MVPRFIARRRHTKREPEMSRCFVPPPCFRIAFENSDLTVWVDHLEATHALPEERGVVLGWAFSKGAPRDTGRMAPISRQPTDLFGQIWGGYVAFVVVPDRGEVHVIRDPSGIMPCLRVQHLAGEWLVSDMATARDAGLVCREIDWTGLALHLQAAALPLERTALAEVRELLPGFALRLDGSSCVATAHWSPWAHIGAAEPWSYPSAVAALREAIDQCVGSWGSAFDGIILDLSGGLDSSILAAALAADGRPSRALTYATDDAGPGDERAYARMVAEHCGVSLTEALLAVDDVDILRPTFADLPVPIGRCIGQAMDAPRGRLAAQERTEAFFNGVGGDNLLCYLQSAAPVADRWRAEGFGRGSWQSVQDVSALTGASMARVMRLARRLLRSGSPEAWRPHMALLDPACRAPATALHHPWLEAPSGALPGKVRHVAALMRVPTHFHALALGGGIASISPFRSQPLVELCLSIPSWFWCRGGRNRSVARDGFAGRLPASTLARRSKAGPETFCFQLLEHHRPLIRERLLDGHLAQQGILDRAAVEGIFASNAPIMAGSYLRLLELVDAEAWIDHWLGCRSTPARMAAH
jgi:asparagine synthase (glutamine-hydrolysing)